MLLHFSFPRITCSCLFIFLQRSDSLYFAILREFDLLTFSCVQLVQSMACLLCHIAGGFCAWKLLFSSEWRRISIHWRVNREGSERLADGNGASNDGDIAVNPPITVLTMSITKGQPIGVEKNEGLGRCFLVPYLSSLLHRGKRTCRLKILTVSTTVKTHCETRGMGQFLLWHGHDAFPQKHPTPAPQKADQASPQTNCEQRHLRTLQCRA